MEKFVLSTDSCCDEFKSKLRKENIETEVYLEDKKIKAKNKPTQEEKSMEKTLKIEGMMCGHCEATVKKALEAIEGVEAAVVSHEKGTAVVTLTKEIDADVFRKIIEDKDFTFIGIE